MGEKASEHGLGDRGGPSGHHSDGLGHLERDVLALIAECAPVSIVLDALVLGLERCASPGTLAALHLFDDSLGVVRHGAAPSLPPGYSAAVDGLPIGPAAGSCGTAVFRRERVIVTDIATDPLWKNYRALALPWGLRACWSQPIFSPAGIVLGTLAFYYREVRSPTPADLASIDAAARLVRIVVERQHVEISRGRASRREAAQLDTARALAEGESVEQAMTGALGAVGTALDLDVGAVWLEEPELGKLTCVAQWARHPERFRRFIEETATQAFAPGEGLAGRVFVRAAPEWVALTLAEAALPRAQAATEAGLRAGFALPIIAGREVVGAIDFFTSRVESADADLLRALRTVGLQVGQFLRGARVRAEREQLGAELQDAVRYSEILHDILAHDLRDPLRAMMTETTQLQLRIADDRNRATLARIDSNGRRMARKIDQLLDVARTRNGVGIPIVRRPIDLRTIARTVLDEIASTYPERALAVEIDGDLQGSWDKARLCQVLSNLLSNAIQHGNPAFPVELRANGHDEDFAVVEVRNAGSIAPDLIPSLFAPFKRGSERLPGGVGLGLYITQQIVQAHHGRMTVASKDGVTTFRVELPRV